MDKITIKIRQCPFEFWWWKQRNVGTKTPNTDFLKKKKKNRSKLESFE